MFRLLLSLPLRITAETGQKQAVQKKPLIDLTLLKCKTPK